MKKKIFVFAFEKKKFFLSGEGPTVLIICSRLPVISQSAYEKCSKLEIFPFGFPLSRILPFRYLFERRVRNNRSTNLMSDLWKKKLLDEHRTHVLKDSNCSEDSVRFYFQQIFSQIVQEKYDEDDDDSQQKSSWPDRCRQAFVQANIEIELDEQKNKSKEKCSSSQLVDQLNELVNVIGRVKQEVQLDKSNKILRTTNKIQEKRSIDENEKPKSTKRFRTSLKNGTNNEQTSDWNPPSKEIVDQLQIQSSSLFQFILSLVRTIFDSNDDRLTDEQFLWLKSTANAFGHQYNNEKVQVLIETACQVTKINQCQMNN